MASDRTPRPVPANVICYGDARSLPRPIPLRAGPLELLWQDGALRSIFLGRRELVKQVYAAVRDPNWVTIPGQISNLRINRTETSFLIRFRSTHRESPIHFVWDGRIEGSPAGTLRFEMRGVARSTFRRARIGLCVLHPADTCAGVPCWVLHDEKTENARFPLAIAPEAPATGFHSMRGLSFEAEPGVRVQLRFEGDVFEMEDQRNWTDASFKTFSTPLLLPVPVEVERGSRVDQSFSLELSGSIPVQEPKPVRDAPVTLRLRRKPLGKVPRVGLGSASHGFPLTPLEVRRLARLGLSHLRVDVNLAEADWKEGLLTAVVDAGELGVALEVALLNHGGALPDELTAAVRLSGAKVSTWLLFPNDRGLAAQIQRQFPASGRAAGTNANFIYFNESPPKGGHLDVATFAIHPQTHATDNDSLVETLEIQGQLVSQARELTGGLPVMVSPITLKPRFNPDATGPEPPPAPGRLPSQVDVRQMSLFGACWTLGSLKYLAEAGVESTTWFETTGWRGVLERRQGSLLPKVFRSLSNGVFPMYYVFAWLADFRRRAVLPLRSDSPLRVAGFAVRRKKHTRMMLANFTGSVQPLVFRGAPDLARVLIVDENKAYRAMIDPEAFVRQKGRVRRLDGLTLPRYGLARVDVIEDE